MFCPFCSNKKTRVVDSRFSTTVRRRRECQKCLRRFSTQERPLLQLSVIKRDGTKEPFNKEKIYRGLSSSCQKRLTEEEVWKIVDYIERKITNRDSVEVKSSLLGRLVMKELRKRDKVAYLRFASVYKKFDGVAHFEEELKKLR